MAKKAKNGATDAIELLKADHRAVEDLFEAFEEASGNSKKAKLAQKICMELSIHSMIEEEMLYPICRGPVEDNLIDEAYVEHDGAKLLIAEIMAADAGDEFYDAKVKVLSEMIKHHVKEEEQREGIFAQLKASDADLLELGERMAARKDELKQTFESEGIPMPTTRSLKGAEVEYGHPFQQ